MSATNRNINYPRCKAQHRWCFIDAHSKNGVVTVLLSLSPIKAANMSVMNNSDHVTRELPYLQDHKSFTHRWPTFHCIVHSTSAAVNNRFHHDLTLLVVFLSDCDSALRQSRVVYYWCTVHSHTTKHDVYRQMIHCICYTSVYQPIFTSYFSWFTQNIYLTENLGQAT